MYMSGPTLAAMGTPVIKVECDRCHRPGWRLETGPLTGRVRIEGTRVMALDDEQAMADLLRGQRHRAADPPFSVRPGAVILSADDPQGEHSDRVKLVWVGRKHPPFGRVVTSESADRAYRAAVATDRTSIRLSEI